MQCLAWTELQPAGQRRISAINLSITSVARNHGEVISKGTDYPDRQAQQANGS